MIYQNMRNKQKETLQTSRDKNKTQGIRNQNGINFSTELSKDRGKWSNAFNILRGS